MTKGYGAILTITGGVILASGQMIGWLVGGVLLLGGVYLLAEGEE
jgi:hypothetical protein